MFSPETLSNLHSMTVIVEVWFNLTKGKFSSLKSIHCMKNGILHLRKYEDTIKDCTKALELNPNYLKALLRRGEAGEKLEHFEEAIADLKKVLELDHMLVVER
ncbi:Tetratricopeptide repeat protein 1 [Camellia lanceoleosa]|uniref:Tetratricopeptide repeat protein 1 n=1 Tax=Camellia lanceoleosa TaxID=1840588 RepID=A0ACC0HJA2_9ERIC|nr:Tetratricopeptide repeat protein 1 [Camellia lanceoleosa]